MNKQQLPKLRRNSKEHLFRTDMHIALGEIKRYEARLHMIVLNGKKNYPDLVEALGKLKIDNNFEPDKRNPIYNTKAIRQEKDFYLSIFVNPKINTSQWCTIEVHSKKDLPVQTHKDFLKELNKKLPDINVSAVEYAIDVFC